MKKVNSNFIEKEDLVEKSIGRNSRRLIGKRKTWETIPLQSFFAIIGGVFIFFLKASKTKMEATSSQTQLMFTFQKIAASH